MAEQKVKTLNNQLISWLAFRAEKEAEIEELKQEIAEKTEEERTRLKSIRKDVNVAIYMQKETMKELEELAERSGEIKTIITLDDFDVSDQEINIELAREKYKSRDREE